MQRRDFIRLGAAALTFGLLPAMGSAQNAGNKLKENENFLLDKKQLRLRVGGKTVRVDHVVLMEGGKTYSVDMRQPSPVKREAKLGGASNVPLLGGLTTPPIAQQIKRGRAVGDIYLMGRTLIIPLASAGDLPDPKRAIIPLPYPGAKTSLRPARAFKRAALKGAPTAEAVKSQGRVVGTAVLVKEGLALAMSGAGT